MPPVQSGPPRDAKALAALKHAPHLQTLVLVLTGNPIANEGAKALGELAESESLKALMLHLCRTSIGAQGGPRPLIPTSELVSAELTLNETNNNKKKCQILEGV